MNTESTLKRNKNNSQKKKNVNLFKSFAEKVVHSNTIEISPHLAKQLK